MSDEESPTPRLFDHAKRVYEEMCKRSTKVVNDSMIEASDGLPLGEITVYEGHLTTLFSELSIANPYYTKIRDALVGQNCMVQLRRGGGSALSKWVMLTPPTEEGFREIMERKTAPKGKLVMLEQQVTGLRKIVNDLETRLEILEASK